MDTKVETVIVPGGCQFVREFRNWLNAGWASENWGEQVSEGPPAPCVGELICTSGRNAPAKCKNSPDNFRYVCGSIVFKSSKQ